MKELLNLGRASVKTFTSSKGVWGIAQTVVQRCKGLTYTQVELTAPFLHVSSRDFLSYKSVFTLAISTYTRCTTTKPMFCILLNIFAGIMGSDSVP